MYEQTNPSRKSWFFAAVLFIANAYFIGFALDAGTSVLDDFVNTLAGSSVAPLDAVRDVIANLVVVASYLMLVVLVIAPRLPKLLFLPLIAFAIWCSLDAPPLLWPGQDAHPVLVVLAIAQAAIASAAFLILKARTDHWLLTPEGLPRPRHPGLRIALSGVATILVVPVVIGSLLVLDVAALIQSQTDGYIEFTSSGINLKETVLRKDDKTAILVGMLHVGEPRFYDTLYASFPKDALILEEGVTDREKRLAGNFSYRKFARLLGLEQQPRVEAPSIAPPGQGTTSSTGPAPNSPPAASGSAQEPKVLRPDVDVSDFSESTIRFLARVGEIYQGGGLITITSRIEAVMNDFSDSDIKKFYDDVVHNRNHHVLSAFDEEMAHYNTIVIPWGAMHMPELEQQLKQRGFAVQSRRELPLIRYSTILKRIEAGSQSSPPAG